MPVFIIYHFSGRIYQAGRTLPAAFLQSNAPLYQRRSTIYDFATRHTTLVD
jgi:hypothetical protein